MRIAFGNCEVLQEPQDPSDISIEGNQVTLTLNRFMSANPNCGIADTRIEGEIEIGVLPEGDYQFDLVARQSFGSLRPLYTGIEFGVSNSVPIPAFGRTTTVALALLLMLIGARRLITRT